MPYSLLGQNNDDHDDASNDSGFLARMQKQPAKPSVLAHARWLVLGVLIGSTVLVVYQTRLDMRFLNPFAADNPPTTTADPSIRDDGAAIAARSDRSSGSGANASGDANRGQSAVIRQGTAGARPSAAAMELLPRKSSSRSETPSSPAATQTTASDQSGEDDGPSISDDYPSALLAGSLALSGPSLQDETARKTPATSDEDPDVAILQLLLQRIDKNK